MHAHSPARRRMLTVAAIILMVSSALVSFFLVQENDRHIAELKRSEERMDQSIRTFWENAAATQRDADTAVIVSLLARDALPQDVELKRYYLARTGTVPQASLMEVLKAADDGRRHAVDAINDIYISRLDVENEIMARDAANKRYASFAFMLQLIGLVLVILTREMHGV